MTIRQRVIAWIRSIFDPDGYENGSVLSSDTPATVTDLDEATEWAQEATAVQDWPEAVHRWGTVLSEFEDTPPKAYSRLGIALREIGRLGDATEAIERGRARHPEDVRLALNWAQLAMEDGDWEEAINRWDQVLKSFDDLPPKAYAWVSICYREQRAFDKASAILEWARARFPDADRLHVDWVELALARRDWKEAVLRCEEALRELGARTPPKVFARLSIAYREMGDFDRAAQVLQEGRSRYPEDVQLSVDWAQLAAEQDRWHEATERWEMILDRFAGRLPAKVLKRAVAEYRHQGRFDVATNIVELGRQQFPEDEGLATQEAHLAMVEGDWLEAIRRWQEVIDLARPDEVTQDGTNPWKVHRLPVRAPQLDWHEGAWQKLAKAWPDDPTAYGLAPTTDLYRSIATALREVGDVEAEGKILALARRSFPHDEILRWEHLLNELERRRPGPGLSVDTEQLRSALREVTDPPVEELGEEVIGGRDLLPDLSDFDRRTEVLDEFADFARQHVDGLSRICRLRVPRGSDVELQVRSGRFFTQRSVGSRIRELSERETWEELEEGNEPLLRRARSISKQYAERYEEAPYLPSDVLDDASFLLLYSEMCVYEPIRRLAADIAQKKDSRPIFVEVPSSTFTYLNGYAENNLGKFEFAQIFLYFELRSRGANAFLVEIVNPSDVSNESPLVFVPSRSLMQARPVERSPRIPSDGEAIIPAGIRSIEHVIDNIGEPLVLSSGFIIQKFAYDRWFRKGRSLELDSGIHPPRSLLPKITVRVWDAGHLEGTLAAFDVESSVRVPVQVSATLGGDWLSWFDHVMHEFLVDMSRRAHAEVALREIKVANVCDHLFTESAIFSAAVQKAGGDVVLWPHSTNPVHFEVRRPDSFDVVHAVTKTGCEQWAQQFPNKRVVHTSSTMLPPPKRENVLDPDEPLSVVVLGGKTSLGAMPFVHQTQHERSFRRFFDGLKALCERYDIEVMYKPKGLFGENERWLESLVGTSMGWRSVTAHPLRIDLPNMLFVSISVGSSALFEGLSRGIPCLIVRDFETKEYTTFVAGSVPIGPTSEMLNVIEECTHTDALEALIERQLDYYRSEAGLM